MNRKPEWITQEKMAAHCKMSISGFRKWQVEPAGKNGRQVFYRFSDVLKNRLTNLESRLTKSASTGEISRAERVAKLRLIEAQAEGQEIRNAQLRRELAPVAVIEWTLGKVGSQIAAILDSIPMQLKKRNSKLTASNIELIKREIIKTQNIAAQVQVDYDEYDRNTN